MPTPKQSKTEVFQMRTTSSDKQALQKVATKLKAKSVADAIRIMTHKELKRKPRK